MSLSRKIQIVRNAVSDNSGPAATLACVFATALAVSCMQSGLTTLALVPTGIAAILAAAGLLSRLPRLAPIPARVTRRKP